MMSNGPLYLITGATGHLGLNLVHLLLAKGRRVHALVLPHDPMIQYLPKDVEIFEGDVTDYESMKAFFMSAKPDDESMLVHTAGIVDTGWRFNQKVYDVNVEGTHRMLQMAKEFGIKKFIYVSSVHALVPSKHHTVIDEHNAIDPSSIKGFYGKTKAEATRLAFKAFHEHQLPTIVVFPSGLIGPYDYHHGHMTQLIDDYRQHKINAAIEGGYDFSDVRDVAEGIILAATKGIPGEGYILGNQFIKLTDLYLTIDSIQSETRTPFKFKKWFLFLMLPFINLFYKITGKKPLFSLYSLYTIGSDVRFSSEKAIKELGYQTRPMVDTLRDTIAWLKTLPA